MALMYDADLDPTKQQVVEMLLPTAQWFDGDPAGARIVGHYRFDDPAGEVGIEGQVVVTGDGTHWHVPLTYRGEPCDEAQGGFITNMSHSELGTRWVYDACHDPVAVTVLARALASGADQAVEEPAEGGEPLDPGVAAHGTGSSAAGDLPAAESVRPTPSAGTTWIDAGSIDGGPWRLEVVHRLATAGSSGAQGEALVATWPGQSAPVVLATLHRQG